MYKTALIAGAFFAGLSVILGAFGAHALKEVLAADQLQTFETGVRYEMYHGIALLITGVLSQTIQNKMIRLSAIFFIIGTILFSGSLYLLVSLKASGQVGLGGLGLITPIGGVFFILGWILLILAIIKKQS